MHRLILAHLYRCDPTSMIERERHVSTATKSRDMMDTQEKGKRKWEWVYVEKNLTQETKEGRDRRRRPSATTSRTCYDPGSFFTALSLLCLLLFLAWSRNASGVTYSSGISNSPSANSGTGSPNARTLRPWRCFPSAAVRRCGFEKNDLNGVVGTGGAEGRT